MTVKFGQDLQVRKLLYQEVRFLSEGWYRIFWERRSCTKKCEKTLRMVRLCPAREDPDQIEHLLLPREVAKRTLRNSAGSCGQQADDQGEYGAKKDMTLRGPPTPAPAYSSPLCLSASLPLCRPVASSLSA